MDLRPHLGMGLLVLLGGQVCAGCNKGDDEGTHVGPGTGDSDDPPDTGTSTSTVTTGIVDLTGITADLTATAADPGEAPFEAICAFYDSSGTMVLPSISPRSMNPKHVDLLNTRMLLTAAWRVTGDPPERRTTIPCEPGHDPDTPDHEAWYIDTRGAVVAAVWCEGTLWLGGSAMYAVGERVESLAAVTRGPTGADGTVRAWARVTPEPGMRYVVTASVGPTPDEAAVILARRGDEAGALAEALLGAQRPDADSSRSAAAILVIDATASESPVDLLAWIAELQAREVDLSWTGNEGGPGLRHTFTRARRPGQDVRAALREQACDDAVLAAEIAEHASIWLEDRDGEPPSAGQLVAGAPERGYWWPVDLDQLATNVCGRSGAWLDPGTLRARLAYGHHISGASVVAALHAHLDDPAALCVASQPDEEFAVLACHVIGGVDRRSGDVVGFVLARIWT